MSRYASKKIRNSLKAFLHTESSSGIVLLVCAVLALLLANGSWADTYFAFLNFKIVNLSVQQWINDGLMVIFFFVVGMELKKEIVAGELSSFKKSILPIAAAIGGMLFPALIYYALNPQGPAADGWGVPMATDIAFAVGILSLFGKRVPLSLKVFLLALAIVDDLGAILVIALFYTREIRFEGLLLAGTMFGLMAVIKKVGVKNYFAYVALGILTWLGVLYSGVHATIAGVVIGFLTPLSFKVSREYEATYSPLDRLMGWLHPWVSFLIMPIFALANAGIDLRGLQLQEVVAHPIQMGVALGLFVGKMSGIFALSFLFVQLGWARLPNALKWTHILGVGALGGVGFTMALFISGLALPAELAVYSKVGIILGSIVSAVFGAIILSWAFAKPTKA